MHAWDWAIVVTYCLGVTALGLWYSRRAKTSEDFFLSGRSLPWWLAGVSLVATSFASDTPLFITGLVREHGVAGNWHWWFLIPGTVAGQFFFARLWRRAKVVTSAELVELRYGPGAGGILRAFQAVLMGFLYNVYVLGAWPILGLTKVLEETTAWPKAYAVVFCGGLALAYAVSSGLWGVVATDAVQFVFAMIGAITLAIFAVDAVGGASQFVEKVAELPESAFLPVHTPDAFWSSPWVFFVALFAVQWWARGLEGDGLQVQRMSACKNERHSFYAMMVYNIGHYAVRPWPWIVAALASMLLYPEVLNLAGEVDHERAYPRMIVDLLPVGVRGVLVASFFAAFMSTVDSHLNWGSSQVINDVYRRYMVKGRAEAHYVLAARVATVVLMICGGLIALVSASIVEAFYNILLVFSGVGLVGTARWFWWRVNAWSEISAMIASGVLTLLAPVLCQAWGWESSRTVHMGIVVLGATALWVTVTFLTKPTDAETLRAFYRRVRPVGPGWRAVARETDGPRPDAFGPQCLGWMAGTIAVTAVTVGIGHVVLGHVGQALGFFVATIAGALGVRRAIARMDFDQ